MKPRLQLPCFYSVQRSSFYLLPSCPPLCQSLLRYWGLKIMSCNLSDHITGLKASHRHSKCFQDSALSFWLVGSFSCLMLPQPYFYGLNLCSNYRWLNCSYSPAKILRKLLHFWRSPTSDLTNLYCLLGFWIAVAYSNWTVGGYADLTVA